MSDADETNEHPIVADEMKTEGVEHLRLHVTHRGSSHTPRARCAGDRVNGKKMVPRRQPKNPYDSNCIELCEPVSADATTFVGQEYAALISPLVDCGVLEFVDAEVVHQESSCVCIRVRVLRQPRGVEVSRYRHCVRTLHA
jgi:hypothetical protein